MKTAAGVVRASVIASIAACVVAACGADRPRPVAERVAVVQLGAVDAGSPAPVASEGKGYDSSVSLGNQTVIGDAARPFAIYLSEMHRRIHPFFDDSLATFDRLPGDKPLSDLRLFTRLEVVLGADGRIMKMGVVRTSGNVAFDVAALGAFLRAAPFGPPPPAILSSDGRVYVHWDMHRDPVLGCSTANARPYLLTVP